MQFFIFMICLFCGIISGVVYDVLYIARSAVCGVEKQNYTVKDKIFIVAADILYCLVFAAGFVFVSVLFNFTGFRLYMLIGCILGAALYLKSFHLIVAFFVKKVYNIKVKRQRRKKEQQIDSGEEKPLSRRRNGKRSNFNSNTRRRRNISARNDRKDGKPNKKAGRRIRKVRKAS